MHVPLKASMLMVSMLVIVSALKKRSWIDKKFYFEGVPPDGRVYLGMASENQKLYVFGGRGSIICEIVFFAYQQLILLFRRLSF
jgi:hypothetical protein